MFAQFAPHGRDHGCWLNHEDHAKTLLICGTPALERDQCFAQGAQPGAPGIGDSLYPGFGNGGYDVQHYTLDLTVDPASGSLDGGRGD